MAKDGVKQALDALVNNLKPTLEAVAAAHGKRDKLKEKRAALDREIEAMNDEIAEAHAGALAAGWTAAQLKRSGFNAPTRKRPAKPDTRPVSSGGTG